MSVTFDPNQVREMMVRATMPDHPEDQRRWTAPNGRGPHCTRTGHLLGAMYVNSYISRAGNERYYVVLAEDSSGAVQSVDVDRGGRIIGGPRWHRTHRHQRDRMVEPGRVDVTLVAPFTVRNG